MSKFDSQDLLKCHIFCDVIILKSQSCGVASVISQDRIDYRITLKSKFQENSAYWWCTLGWQNLYYWHVDKRKNHFAEGQDYLYSNLLHYVFWFQCRKREGAILVVLKRNAFSAKVSEKHSMAETCMLLYRTSQRPSLSSTEKLNKQLYSKALWNGALFCIYHDIKEEWTLQEEVENRSVTLAISATKLSIPMLKNVIAKLQTEWQRC